MATKITSPITGFTGSTMFGPIPVTFTNGVAHLDEAGDGLRSYLLGTGYTVEDEPAEVPEVEPATSEPTPEHEQPTDDAPKAAKGSSKK